MEPSYFLSIIGHLVVTPLALLLGPNNNTKKSMNEKPSMQFNILIYRFNNSIPQAHR